jgi:hypothetical protein
VSAFEQLYQRNDADAEARQCFKNLLRRQLISTPHERVQGCDDLIKATRAGGDMAEDITLVLFETPRQLHDFYGGPGSFPGIQSLPTFAPAGQQRPGRTDMPPRNTNWLSASPYRPPPRHLTPTDDPTPRPIPRSGWAETAPPSEISDDHTAEYTTTVHLAGTHTNPTWNWDNIAAGDGEEGASDGGARLGPSTDWMHPNEWEHTAPTAIGVARARSASEIANDGWSLNNHGRDGSWDTAAATAQSWQPVHLLSGNPGTLPMPNAGTAGTGAIVNQPAPAPAPAPANDPALQRPPFQQLPAPPSSTAPPLKHYAQPDLTIPILHDPVTASRSQMEMNHPPFPMPTPTVFPHPGDGPIGMPHYIPYLGYNHYVSLGNGMLHTTSPGLYGLAGRTMIATMDSGWDCSLYFRAGDIITNAVRL